VVSQDWTGLVGWLLGVRARGKEARVGLGGGGFFGFRDEMVEGRRSR
jgi:hypothetical protein